MKPRHILPGIVISTAMLVMGAQQQQSPPGTPPPQPPAGAANGPQPGPATQAQTPGPGQRTGEPKAPAASSEQEAVRNFLAIGAPPNAEAAKRGQALFVANCGFCHGSNAGGGATGPNLVRSVVVLHDSGTGKEIGPVVHNGRPGKGMPAFPNLTDDQIHDIAQFLLGRTQAVANRMEYKIQNIVTGNPQAGEAYFQQHCSECHSATGDLAHIAAKYDSVALQNRFLYPAPPHEWGAAAPPDPKAEKTVTVTLPSGQTYSGRLDRIDDFSVALTDSSNVYHSWVLQDENGIRVDVHDPLAQHAKLLRQYTDADMHNILAYLETLK